MQRIEYAEEQAKHDVDTVSTRKPFTQLPELLAVVVSAEK